MVRVHHLIGLYVAAGLLLLNVPVQNWITTLAGILCLWTGIHFGVKELQARWNARRLHRNALESGSDYEMGLDMDWMDRPL